MAILESRTKTGMSWVKESIALFKTAPPKFISLSIVYIAVIVILPSLKALEVVAHLLMIVWPLFLALAMNTCRNIELKKFQTASQILTLIKPKLMPLITLGVIFLLYGTAISYYFFNDDIVAMQALMPKQGVMTVAQSLAVAQKAIPLLFKMFLLITPLFMATWFSPMLIAFNNYDLVKAIKSSIAGSLQYMIALATAWILLSSGIIVLMLTVGIAVGIVGSLAPALAQMLTSFLIFGCFLLATALMLAFQYVSYRDVFRAA
jgi:hypothetical protein